MGKQIKQVAAIEGLFTWPSDNPKLIAGQCASCKSVSFPSSKFCSNPDCTDEKVSEVELSPNGKLHSYTIQNYPPPPPYVKPDPFKPFAIGLVELPEKIRVVGMITGCDLKDIKVGMDVKLVAEKIYEKKIDGEMCDVMTWKWTPVKN